MLLTLHTFIFNGHRFVSCSAAFHFWNCLGLWSPLISAEYSNNNKKKESENGGEKSTPRGKTCPLIIIKHIIILIHDLIFKHLIMPAIEKGIPGGPASDWLTTKAYCWLHIVKFEGFCKATLYYMDVINKQPTNQRYQHRFYRLVSGCKSPQESHCETVIPNF